MIVKCYFLLGIFKVSSDLMGISKAESLQIVYFY